MSNIEHFQKTGRYYDIIKEALEDYRGYMLDDDYNAQGCLDRIINRMRERLEMSDAPNDFWLEALERCPLDALEAAYVRRSQRA